MHRRRAYRESDDAAGRLDRGHADDRRSQALVCSEARERSMSAASDLSTSNSQRAVLSPPALGYLTSQYPMLSMIFVLREIVQLRRLGFRIETASISMPDRLAEA